MDEHNTKNLIINFNAVNQHLYGMRDYWENECDPEMKSYDEIKQLFLDEWLCHIIIHDIWLCLLQDKLEDARRLKKTLIERASKTIDNVDTILEHEGHYLKCCDTLKTKIDAVGSWVQ